MSAVNIITNYFCPILGCVLANIMWISPLYTVLKARSNHSLGTLNPIPFGITVFNSIGWSAYGLINGNYYIYCANFTGLCLGLFYTVTSLSILYSPHINQRGKDVHKMLELLLIGSFAFYSVIFFIIGIIFVTTNITLNPIGSYIVGYISFAASISYYISPFSTLKTIIVTKDSSSLHMPMIMANTLNSLMWCSYGIFAMNDPIIYAPNVLGLLFSIIQMSLCIYFPKKITRNFSVKLDAPISFVRISSDSFKKIFGYGKNEYESGFEDDDKLTKDEALYYSNISPPFLSISLKSDSSNNISQILSV